MKPLLSPIFPVVLAQSSQPWRTEPRFGALFGQAAAAACTPDFAFELIQLVTIGYEEMRGSAAGVLSMRALRADALGELLHATVFDETLLLRASETAVERLFRHISSRDVDRNDFRKNLNKLRNSDLKEKAMTLAEQWREEGREAEAQRSVVDVLETRFGCVPEGLAEKIGHEPDLAELRSLHIQALKASSIEDFASHLEG